MMFRFFFFYFLWIQYLFAQQIYYFNPSAKLSGPEGDNYFLNEMALMDEIAGKNFHSIGHGPDLNYAITDKNISVINNRYYVNNDRYSENKSLKTRLYNPDKTSYQAPIYEQKSKENFANVAQAKYSPFQVDIGGLEKDKIKEKYLEMFKEAKKDLDQGKDVTFVFSGHGASVMSEFDYMGKSISDIRKSTGAGIEHTQKSRNSSESMILSSDIGELMNKAGLNRSGPPWIKIISEHCLGGAYHELIHQFKNICVSSFSNTKENVTAHYGLPQMFWHYVHRYKKYKGQAPSMHEAFFSSYFSTDHWNLKNHSQDGKLSTRSYIDDIMDPYDKANREYYNNVHDQENNSWNKLNYSLSLKSNAESECKDLSLSLDPMDSNEVENFLKIVNASLISPKFKEALKVLDDYKDKFSSISRRYKELRTGIEKCWSKIPLKEKILISDHYYRLGNVVHPEKISACETDIFKDLNEYKKLGEEISKYLKARDVFLTMKDQQEFFQKHGNDKEKMNTFSRLYECENSPL